jgi:cytochrome P450 family 135
VGDERAETYLLLRAEAELRRAGAELRRLDAAAEDVRAVRAFDLLLHHPRALSRLVADLDRGASEYLDATITETLRIRPVVALVDRRVRQAVRIGGHTIPAGVVVCPNIYLAQRRPDLYQDPAAFRPDRFVGQTPPVFGWFPFGGGIRRCLGANFATFEMRIVLPEVLQAVTLRPASRRPARVRREAVTFVPHDGARCVVTARMLAQLTAAPGWHASLVDSISLPRSAPPH